VVAVGARLDQSIRRIPHQLPPSPSGQTASVLYSQRHTQPHTPVPVSSSPNSGLRDHPIHPNMPLHIFECLLSMTLPEDPSLMQYRPWASPIICFLSPLSHTFRPFTTAHGVVVVIAVAGCHPQGHPLPIYSCSDGPPPPHH